MNSHLRQVPDNQEVFVYDRNNVSIIVEVLQAVEELEDAKAIGQVTASLWLFMSLLRIRFFF
jgi:hypothetical protein